MIFPGTRLVRERQKQSKKRMRIKNWLLLLARMALFGAHGACACPARGLFRGSAGL